jgi:hypothetical protein
MREFLNGDRWTMPLDVRFRRREIEAPLRLPLEKPMLPKTADALSGIELIARALRTTAEVARDDPYLQRSGQHPPRRVDLHGDLPPSSSSHGAASRVASH